MTEIDKKCIATLRMLSVEQVEKAASGHPGFPLGTAPLMYTIWKDFLNYNPKNPNWENRDRFVLSAGHGSALLYSMLHLAGFDLSIDDLKSFRQWGSKTPGHPEYGDTPGVEATTGPLGTGFATGVGMAIAEKMLAAKYNKPNYEIIDHYVYGIVSDGDLMEGVSSEAASLASTLGLGKIIYLYDDNNITIEGTTDIAFTENVQKRFDAYGWHTIRVENSEDVDSIINAITEAKKVKDKPSLILVKTHIGFNSPKQDSPSAHGEPLGKDAIEKTSINLGFTNRVPFDVEKDVRDFYAEKADALAKKEADWQKRFDEYKSEYSELYSELTKRYEKEISVNQKELEKVFDDIKATSTREASGEVLQKLSQLVPALVGGSADLAPSNKTYVKGAGDFSKDNPLGRNIHFGVRELAMTCISNGIALHGGFVPYAGTFLVFADFMRPGIRLASLMNIPSVFVLTHDSICVGEDGPTHQPVEHIMSLRIIPNLLVLRPADALETAEAWRIALESKKPCALVLTRQKLPVLHEYAGKITNSFAKGGYILSEEKNNLDATLIATGSEIALALEVQKELLNNGINLRVVSMPSWEFFDMQTKEYKTSVVGNDKPVFSLEAGSSIGWAKYTKSDENIIGLDRFGASAPGGEVYDKLGFNVKNVADKIKNSLR